ncbi:hypothetical protein [Cellulomonas palmilytica]|uniref:hypothetical protein n=1 Tax=Cellulomonas palmilytica TaxID=2608402 RepID=UPI001F3F22BF|nr:hypothetical protein [Cellulomonas palmilytica]UJP40424.1 hypothetical protein F1D97_02530 [Cellulomonas palmilytica]
MLSYFQVIATPVPTARRLSADQDFVRKLRFTPGWRMSPPSIEWQLQIDQPTDWVRNIDQARAVSPAVREVVEPLLGPADEVQWIPATVRTREGDPLPYWVMHFPHPTDIYDEDRTIRGASPIPMSAALSAAKLEGHTVVPGPLTSYTYLAEPVLQAMKERGLTGYSIEKRHHPR